MKGFLNDQKLSRANGGGTTEMTANHVDPRGRNHVVREVKLGTGLIHRYNSPGIQLFSPLQSFKSRKYNL